MDVDTGVPLHILDPLPVLPHEASAGRSNACNIGVKRGYGDSVMVVAGRATTVMRASVSRT